MNPLTDLTRWIGLLEDFFDFIANRFLHLRNRAHDARIQANLRRLRNRHPGIRFRPRK